MRCAPVAAGQWRFPACHRCAVVRSVDVAACPSPPEAVAPRGAAMAAAGARRNAGAARVPAACAGRAARAVLARRGGRAVGDAAGPVASHAAVAPHAAAVDEGRRLGFGQHQRQGGRGRVTVGHGHHAARTVDDWGLVRGEPPCVSQLRGRRGTAGQCRDLVEPRFGGKAHVAGNGHNGTHTEARDEDEHIHPGDH